MPATMELSARATTAPHAKSTRGHVLFRSALVGAGVVAAGAFVALVAWGVEAAGLGAAPSWLTMKANTAGALLTGSVSLLLLVIGEQHSSSRLRVAGQTAAGVTLAIVFVSLLAFGIGNEFNFDEFLLQDDPDGTRSLAPARMAPVVWSGLTLLGVALLQLSRRPAMRWADAAAVALPIAFGWLSVLCVLYGVPAFEDFPGQSQLAVHTSLSFVLLGAAVLAARGRTGVIGVVVSRSSAGTVVRQLLPAVFLVPAVLGWIRLQGQSIGLYETEFGAAMLVLGFTACFTALVAHSARSVWSAEAARRETAAALRHSESKYALLFAEAPVAMYRTSPDGVLLDANKALMKLLGASDPSMIIGSNVRRWYVDPGDREDFKAAIERDGVANGQVIQLCRDDGRIVWVMDTSRRVTDPQTGHVSFEGGLADVTERRAATEQVRASERRFRALIEHSADGLALVSRDGTVLYQSPAAQRILGRAPEARVGRNVGEFVHADDRDKVTAAFREVVQEPGALRRVEVRYLHGDETWHYLDSSLANYLEDPDIGAIVVNYRDVSERMRTASALRDSDDRFREMAEHISDAFFVVDLTTFTPIYVSPNWSHIWGRPTAEGYDPSIWFDAIHPDDRAAVVASQEAVKRGERSESEFRVARPDGTTRWVRGRVFPVRNGDGVIYRMVGVSTDVTELRQAQDRFTQAQKMEAVGRLAGGVAHDFNNLLTVILADTEMVQSSAKPGSEESEYLAEVRRASESAVGLTRQLLAFSRKQLVEPVVFNLTDAVDDVTKMLRRLIGEDVRLETRLTSDSTAVRADRGQIEQVLTNLAVNARDAMANGGTLTIETAITRLDEGSTALQPDVAPGEYIALIVSDTGSGMSEETRAHAFEPFFTTKGLGKGTGLGLATCHGIVKQAGGHITVYSEPGVGTTFRVLLPRVQPADTRAAASVQAPHPRGVETVLLVEDESGVRRVGARLLRTQGYEVLEARDAAEALQMLAAHAGNVDLLFTDVVLPGIGGRQLADQVRAIRPAIKVLYTSGYTDDVILQHQLIAHDVRLLHKPYSLSSLSTKVRAALDAA